MKKSEWVRFCRLIAEARKNLMAVVNRLIKNGEEDLAEDIFDTVA
jgi:hypothetical protein